jgi:molybdate transport system substrate-binding protein
MASKIISFLVLSLISLASFAEIRGLPNVTVFASSSLSEPITIISREFSKKHQITVSASFDSTSAQERKIEEGETSDLFISAHDYWIKRAKQKGLLDVYSITDLFNNKLALVVSTNGRLNEYPVVGDNLKDKITFLSNRSIMSIGEPSSTAVGMYTKQALGNLEMWENLKSRTIKSYSSKNNIYFISKGETAGISFYSDTFFNDEIKIISLIDESLHDPIIYKAAVVGGKNMENAKLFLEFIKSDFSKAIFKKYGFIT